MGGGLFLPLYIGVYMSVSVDICNSALIKLGAERINALTDDSKVARLCQEQYPKIAKRVLRSHLWTFAIKRALLSPSGVSLEFGDRNLFNIPLDNIRIIGINSNYNYKVEQQYIITELDEVRLSYISSETPEAYYDENFKEALACALAADLCYALTQSNTLKQSLLDECAVWTAEARSFNSMEVTPDDYRFDEWENSRVTGIGGGSNIPSGVLPDGFVP
jgi:hypothetical protein